MCLTSGNHCSLTLNLARSYPMALEKESNRGKEKANNIRGLRGRQGKWYDFIIQEMLRNSLPCSKGKKNYTLQGLQIKRTLMLVLPSFMCIALFHAQTEYCPRIFLKIMLQVGSASWLKLSWFMLQDSSISSLGKPLCWIQGRTRTVMTCSLL